MEFTRTSLEYPPYSAESMEGYCPPVVSHGPDFSTLTPLASPQYSSTGRMDPEFLDNDAILEGIEEDERPIIARGRVTRILSFFPREGQCGTTITVQLVVRQGAVAPNTLIAFRIKMGNTPLMTSIFAARPAGENDNSWELQVLAPDPVELNIASLKVPLIIQALDVRDATIIENVCIGGFKFLTSMDEPAVRLDAEPQALAQADKVTIHAQDILVDEAIASNQDSSETSHQSTGKYASNRKRAQLSIEVPSRDIPKDVNEYSPDVLSPVIIRSHPSRLSQKPGEDAYPASLEIRGYLNSMTRNWSDEEYKDNRRLVEFFCAQSRGHIDVSFAPIYGEDALDSARNVVSCIWWEEAEDFVITSVDAISLLEKLVGARFTIEEKNRIRRNLQGFKPSTISKNQVGCESFFRMLMDFPPPRPRNIEKDVKAFSWSKLSSMLHKVISKYVGQLVRLMSSGFDPDERTNSQSVRIVRDPEGLSDDSPYVVGSTLSATSSPHQPSTDTNASRNGTPYSVNAPSSENKSPNQLNLLEDLGYPNGPGMTTHDSPPFYPSGGLMEISEDAMQGVQSLQTASEHVDLYPGHPEAYAVAFGPSSNEISYGQEAVDPEDNGLPGDMHFATHIFHEYA